MCRYRACSCSSSCGSCPAASCGNTAGTSYTCGTAYLVRVPGFLCPARVCCPRESETAAPALTCR